jgi:hypothetical protein
MWQDKYPSLLKNPERRAKIVKIDQFLKTSSLKLM